MPGDSADHRSEPGGGFGLPRRTVLAAGLSAALGGCMRCADLPRPRVGVARLPIGDAHAHFFNAADLPVTGFFKNVLIPAHIPDWPEVVLALLDIATNVLKRMAVTASNESRHMRTGQGDGREWSADAFAARVAAQGDAVIARGAARRRATADPAADLADRNSSAPASR